MVALMNTTHNERIKLNGRCNGALRNPVEISKTQMLELLLERAEGLYRDLGKLICKLENLYDQRRFEGMIFDDFLTSQHRRPLERVTQRQTVREG